jgi:hypothetical protein
LIRAGTLEARPFFFLNFKGTPSQEGHETFFSGLKINEMALSDQSDFLAFFHLEKMTYWNFVNSLIDDPLSPLSCKMALRFMF